MNSNMTRAQFVKSAGALVGLGLTGAAGVCTSAAPAFADEVAWNKEADILVLGLGACGQGAALQAIDDGASVIVVEKASVACGDAALSHGVIMGNNSRMDKEAGIDISVEEIEQEAWYLNEIPDMEFAHYTVEQSGELLDWLCDHGMPFNNPADFTNKCYSLLPIYHEFEGYGAAFTVLAEQVEQGADEVLYDTRAERLVVDGDGRVVGAVCTTADGGELAIRAGKGVVVATGGYGANNELMKALDPRMDGLFYEGKPQQTGDGIVMASAVGAYVNTLRCEGCYSALVDFHSINYVDSDIHADGGIFVGKDGHRYCKESSELRHRQCILPLYVYDHMQKTGEDHGIIVSPYSKAVQATMDGGVTVFVDDTLEGLAGQLGVDAAGLAEEVEHYNALCELGVDTDFGKTEGMVPFVEGPFYGIEVSATVTQTSGGLVTNNDSQVLALRLYADGAVAREPIPGLYAGGTVTGYNFKWGYALSNALTRGRTAVRHALAGA